MQYVPLGRTGLEVSVAGLGCGGNSRLGQADGKSEADSVQVIRTALDLGVNFLDTAAAYGTEEIVGRAIRDVPRDSVVVSTKSQIRKGGAPLSAADVVRSLDESLRRLGLDHVDVFHLHAVRPEQYERARDDIAPVLLREKEKGKLRHLGITETSPNDPKHEMLAGAVHDDPWEVMMFAFHMMSQNARTEIFPHTRKHGIGTLLMFVVRSLFSRPGYLQETMRGLAADGQIPGWIADQDDPLGFLVHDGGATSVIDAAYRYARHEPGAEVILFGTGDPAHVESNVASILKPPLPAEDKTKLDELFGALVGVGLDLPMTKDPQPTR
jgi:aryl-alcohol dehydrogenase-like predicted oxidoreductase